MQLAMGTKLKIGANSIAELTSIGGLDLTADNVEKTVLDSPNGWREFVQGWKDGGEVSFSGYFNPADTNGQKALYDAFGTGVLTNFVILFPSTLGAEWDFTAIVTGFSTGAELEDGISFEGTLKVSGQPSLGLTASGGLTALSLTGTGGTLSPAFNNGIYSYSFGGVSAASVTITATAASHTLALYVDGVFNQNLTSGSPSTSIAMAIGSKKFTVIAYEAGKTQKVYEVVVIKTA